MKWILENKLYSMLMAVMLIALTGCSKDREFSIEGQLEGGKDASIVLERLDADAGWVQVSTVQADKDGTFSLSYVAPESPDLFRLSCNGKYVYLPVDSTESFTLSAKAADISRGFKLAGSPQAEAMTAFEAEALKVEAYNNADSVQSFKRRVYDRWLKDAKGNIFSYYILMRPMGDGFLIDYTDPLYRAVATSFQTYKPDDPHTPLLAERARQGLAQERKRKGKTTVMHAPETAMIEVSLPDTQEKNVALSSLLGHGKPVVLVFGGMTIPDAPLINMELRKLYEAGKADIYQVCLDSDKFEWQQAAKSLPWTVVFDNEGLQSSAAARYNLASIPAYFIYNAAGELVNSTGDVTAIGSML